MLIARLVRRPPAMTARSSPGVASRGVHEYLPLTVFFFSPFFTVLPLPFPSFPFSSNPSPRSIIYYPRPACTRGIWIRYIFSLRFPGRRKVDLNEIRSELLAPCSNLYLIDENDLNRVRGPMVDSICDSFVGRNKSVRTIFFPLR